MQFRAIVMLAASASLGACASVVDGTHQDMTVNTVPPGASCDLTRNNEKIAVVASTPQTLDIRKTKHDITVECIKPGYQKATHFVKSEIQDATWGNIILGGGIGWAVDSATGSDNKYDKYVNITLVPEDKPAAEAAPAPSTEAPADAPEADKPAEAPAAEPSAATAPNS